MKNGHISSLSDIPAMLLLFHKWLKRRGLPWNRSDARLKMLHLGFRPVFNATKTPVADGAVLGILQYAGGHYH